MRNEIILIGPMLAGKTTTALILSEHLKKPIVNLDEIKWEYFAEYGLTRSHADDLLMNKGVYEMVDFYKPYEALIVEKVLSDHTNCIFDFGAGFTIYDEQSIQFKINNLLLNYANIFLVLPTEDKSINKRIFSTRLRDRINKDPDLVKHYHSLYNLSLYFAEHPANSIIANHVLYKHGLNEAQLVKQVINIIRLNV